jgi:hypothetical protein
MSESIESYREMRRRADILSLIAWGFFSAGCVLVVFVLASWYIFQW